VLLVFSTLADVACAQDVEELMSEGLRLRQEGNDAEAADRFRRAHEQGGGAQALAQLALAEQALGHWVDSADHLEAALTDTNDAWIRRHRRELSAALDTIHSHLGEVEIDGNVEGARVRIDGRDVGQLPLPHAVRTEAGSMIVEAEADGYFPVQRQLTVSPGGLARVTLVLVERASEPTVEPPLAPEPPPLTSTRVPPRIRHVRHPPPPPSTGPRDFLLAGMVTSYAITGLALVGLIAAYAIREANIQIWNDDSRCSPFGPGRDVACPAEGSAWRTAQDWEVASAIVGGVALASGVVFTIFYAITPEQSRATLALAGHF
jgi:hypothetical protein